MVQLIEGQSDWRWFRELNSRSRCYVSKKQARLDGRVIMCVIRVRRGVRGWGRGLTPQCSNSWACLASCVLLEGCDTNPPAIFPYSNHMRSLKVKLLSLLKYPIFLFGANSVGYEAYVEIHQKNYIFNLWYSYNWLSQYWLRFKCKKYILIPIYLTMTLELLLDGFGFE